MPSPPSSVAPRGTPTRPAVEGEGNGDRGIRLSAQERDAFPESPPPSNRAGDGLSEAAHVASPALCEGETGLMPGGAISVEPSGTSVNRADPTASGDVARIPMSGCGVDGVT